MSWLRSSPLRQNLSRQNNNNDLSINTANNCDPRACYDSFCKHWQQAYEIIQRSELAHSNSGHDDVLAVVSHLDFMVTLLLVELHHCNKIEVENLENVNATPSAPCLEYMLSEHLLDKLFEWGSTTGRYANAVRLEQLKLYELLVSHSKYQLLCHEPFLRPLLKLLASSLGKKYPPDVEKRLVLLLNQLCVVLMQNVHLLDLFFFSAAQEQHKSAVEQTLDESSTNFIIFSLLIPYVHREGSLGHQARDALLLCMALSQKNSNIGTYIAQYSSMCPLLVTGLGGLYSRLPNSIDIISIDWHRITPDDVTDIPELTLFMNALEFCNAVVQVAHEMIKHQLLDFMYQGFIVPVLGPAILQTNINSQISAMSYLDLIMRSVTEPALLRCFIRFLLDAEKFDGECVLDALIERLLSSDHNLSMVTMSLFDTLLALHCEDLMLELMLKYLVSGKHVPIAYRHKINTVQPYKQAADFFLDLTPDVMKRARELTKHKCLGNTVSSLAQPLLPSPTSTMSKTIGANWNYYGLHTGESLYANYHAYLFEAHYRIVQCRQACANWSYSYKYQKWPTKYTRSRAHVSELVKEFLNEFGHNQLNDYNSLMAVSGEKKQLDSLQSIGESSGYESFKWRPNDEDEHNGQTVNNNDNKINLKSSLDVKKHKASSSSSTLYEDKTWRTSCNKNELVLTDVDFSEDLFAHGTVNLGPFLNAIWSKLQTFTSNTLYVNLHLTGLITRLAYYSLPLIHSLFMRPDVLITSDTPSFYQVLRMLKQQIDAELPVAEDSLEIIDVARAHLIDREFRLLNTRRSNEISPTLLTPQSATSTYAQISSSSPVQVLPSSSYDPFKRNDIKRKSFGRSLTNIFTRKNNGVTSTIMTNPTVSNRPSHNDTAVAADLGNVRHQEPQHSSTESKLRKSLQETSLSTSPATSTNLDIFLDVEKSSIANKKHLDDKNQNTHINLVCSGNSSEPVSLESLSSMSTLAHTSGTERTRDLALCAILLDEWLKELAAIAEEQSIVMVNLNI